MTVSNTTAKQLYTGTGSLTTFAIPFDAASNSEVEVILRDETSSPITETLQTVPTNYSITGGDPGTNVEMVVAPTATQKLLVRRVNPKTQATDYADSGPFPAQTHENALDKQIRIMQEICEKLERTPKLPNTSPLSDQFLPEPTALEFLRWNSAGTQLEGVGVFEGGVLDPTTTKGDIIVNNGTILIRLAVGTANQVLRVNSATASGLEWANVGGGGGGGANWLSLPGGPIEDTENGQEVFFFEQGLTQTATLWVKVPTGYTAGTQLSVKLGFYSPSSSNVFQMDITSTLVRTGTDAVSSTTNQETDDTDDVTNTVADQLREETLTLTDANGEINNIAVSVGDLIRIDLSRGTPAGTDDTADVRMVPALTEVVV